MSLIHNEAVLSLGTNKGEREQYIKQAIVTLQNHPKIKIVSSSQVLQTKAVGVTTQPDFLNQVIQIETSLNPTELLRELKNMEAKIGRTPSFRWGPREIDIDILLYNNESVKESDLEIPHKELMNRPFMVDLLLEVVPNAWHPIYHDYISHINHRV